MGFTSDITNKTNGKKYLVSTAEDKRAGGWQTAVLERKLFGIPDPLHPVMFIGALDEEHARVIHARVEEIIAALPPSDWECAKWALVNEVLNATQGLDRESTPDLGALAPVQGQAAEAILLALVRDEQLPLDAPEFEAHLAEYRQERSRNVIRMGYRLRLAEVEVIGGRHLVPAGQVDEILRSDRLFREKVEAIAQYLDTHGVLGLGDPVRPYVLGPFEELCMALDRILEAVVKANPVPSGERDLQAEVYTRLLAYGYVYRVAEEIVGQGMGGL